MTAPAAHQGRQRPAIPADWKIEEYADPELLANSEGNHRAVERDRALLRRRKAEISEERARRGA